VVVFLGLRARSVSLVSGCAVAASSDSSTTTTTLLLLLLLLLRALARALLLFLECSEVSGKIK
jgi:MYXO-CTERM domain-containing protein